jgi:acyl carrier protein phosphodiesterase
VNWLAHIFLADGDVECRLGNMLADMVKRQDRIGMSASFMRGVRAHEAIDRFTDAHAIVRGSRARIAGYRLMKGILVDIFYDHFLAANWSQISTEPLEQFTARTYADIRGYAARLPPQVQIAISRLVEEDWLTSYRTVDGIETALRRLSMRLSARRGREFALELAVSELVRNFDGLGKDFAEFFPLLRKSARGSIGSPSQAAP